MASGDSGDSPSNAAIAAMEGGSMARRYFIYKVLLESPLLEAHIFLQRHMLNIGCNTPRWDLC